MLRVRREESGSLNDPKFINYNAMEDNSNFFSEPFFSYHESYEVVKLVHSTDSGVAEIYQARKSLKRFAVKALKKEFRDDPLYVSMLRKEYEIGFQLENQHIIQTYAFEHLPELGFCIILEWIEGRTLDEILLEDSLSHSDYVRIAADICDALTYLHGKMVVHQDVKPSNVMITSDSHLVKLIDLGFADSPSYAVIKQPGGTRKFAAPEQLSAGVEEKSHLSDIYSLGKLLIQMPLRHSRELEKLIGLMLEDEAAVRPQSAEEVKKVILSAVAHSHRRHVLFVTTLVIILIIGICKIFQLDSADSGRKVVEHTAVPHDDAFPDKNSNNEAELATGMWQNTSKGKEEKNRANQGVFSDNQQYVDGAQIPDVSKETNDVDIESEPGPEDNKSGLNPFTRTYPVHWMILLTGDETLKIGMRYIGKSDPEWESKTRTEMTKWVKSQTEGEDELRTQCLITMEKTIGMLRES